MKAYFEKLFVHEQWANAQVLEGYLKAPQAPARALELLSHMVAAQKIWIARIKGISTDTKVWELYEKEALKDLQAENFKELTGLLETEDFSRKVTYRNSRGDEFSNTVSDILTHLALHASYHRGQVVLLIKGQVEPLPTTDYIFYYR